MAVAGTAPGAPKDTEASQIAEALSLTQPAVAAALRLFGEGSTVPFVARYRKEATGGLDETQLRAIESRAGQLRALADRRAVIEKEINAQGQLTDALRKQLAAALTRAELEDLYQPYRPKRRTRAGIARERGLGPLAEQMWQQERTAPAQAARGFVAPDKDVSDVAAALAGARDICAERLADMAPLRARVRQAYGQHGKLRVSKTKKAKEDRTKFDDYAAFEGPVRNMPSHRVLAIARGEAEGVLKTKLEIDLSRHHNYATAQIPLRRHTPWEREVHAVVEDSLKRLVAPAAQHDCRSAMKIEADTDAVDIFARNLRELLLAPPFGGRTVLGIDPGQRTGCKCAVVDGTGKLLAHSTIYLVQGEAKLADAKKTLLGLLKQHSVSGIAVGNGTHGRETERFVKDTLRATRTEQPDGQDDDPVCVSVSESGASIYSASEAAGREFPDLDLTVRGAISIARRLQDPLAELIKLDPKTIGVGQYQHDVDQALLSARLTEVVESCVNQVGVQLNTASARLLSFVAGIGPKVAGNIVAHRDAQGPYRSRRQLLKVKGLGPKAFEQAAGFLRIPDGDDPLDASAVHPERYGLVQDMARHLNVSVAQLVGNPELVGRIDWQAHRGDDVGDFTLADMAEELARPGRDPRSSFAAPKFDDAVQRMEDLKTGMWLEGVVTNVTAFGAFVDVGVHQDGLIHVSQLADRFVRDPSEVAHVGQTVRVRVLDVDLDRRRIALSARGAQSGKERA